MNTFQRHLFDMKIGLTVGMWIFLAAGCLDFGAKENTVDVEGKISSEDGYFMGEFVPEHEPPIFGNNSLTFSLVDEHGRLVEGADITVTPFMPSMGHGTTMEPVVKEEENGNYVVSNIFYIMTGEWSLTINVKTDSAEDAFMLFYEVE